LASFEKDYTEMQGQQNIKFIYVLFQLSGDEDYPLFVTSPFQPMLREVIWEL